MRSWSLTRGDEIRVSPISTVWPVSAKRGGTSDAPGRERARCRLVPRRLGRVSTVASREPASRCDGGPRGDLLRRERMICDVLEQLRGSKARANTKKREPYTILTGGQLLRGQWSTVNQPAAHTVDPCRCSLFSGLSSVPAECFANDSAVCSVSGSHSFSGWRPTESASRRGRRTRLRSNVAPLTPFPSCHYAAPLESGFRAIHLCRQAGGLDLEYTQENRKRSQRSEGAPRPKNWPSASWVAAGRLAALATVASAPGSQSAGRTAAGGPASGC